MAVICNQEDIAIGIMQFTGYWYAHVHGPQVFAMLAVSLLTLDVVATMLRDIRMDAFSSINSNVLLLKKRPDYTMNARIRAGIVHIDQKKDIPDDCSFQVNV